MGRKDEQIQHRPGKKKGKPQSLLAVNEWATHVPPNAAELKTARVYVNYGIECGVNLDGELVRLSNRRHLHPVVGDTVYTDGKIVEGIAPRTRVLARYANEGGVRLIASNLDQVGLVVSASTPRFHAGFVDRYLVYCRIVEIPLFIIANKMDEAEEGFLERLEPFRAAGVDIYPASAQTKAGLLELRRRLREGDTVLSGLSGVGKSTLINRLIRDADIPTQEISISTGKGRHTTTASEAWDFGKHLLIDTPGIKQFGFIGITPRQMLKGFPELQPHAEGCRFENCTHMDEPGCTVRDAFERGEVDERRYDAYRELVRQMGEE